MALLAALGCLALAALKPAIKIDDTARAAARDMSELMATIKAYRLDNGPPIDPGIDPAESGLIGIDYSDLTTTLGDLGAKRASLNPNFAALMVVWLGEAGARPGDRVALSLTGSFPALNLAALSACRVMRLKPLIISSVGASSYGANMEGLTWLDMERILSEAGQIPWRSEYASLGGIIDTGGGLDGTGYATGLRAIQRHGARYLPEGGVLRLEEDMERRWELYFAEGPPKAHVNVGGGVTALGWVPEAALLDNGLLKKVPAVSSPRRGLVFKFFEAGVPVIHLLNIERLAADNQLPSSPAGLEADSGAPWTGRGRLLGMGLSLGIWLALGAWLARREEAASAGKPGAGARAR
jgi:poly-gamma-glutamate system protein